MRSIVLFAAMAAAAVVFQSCGGSGGEIVIRHVNAGDISVGYKEMGAGYPLVMIMGLTGTMDLWDPDVLADLSRNYRVIIFDNRGMGETSAGVKPFTMKQFADDTAAFMNVLGIQRAYVIGWSMGTYIAQELILTYPEMVERLVLYAGDCGGREAVPPSQEVIDKIMSGDPMQLFETLFPADWLAEEDNLERIIELFRSIVTETSQPENVQRQFEAMESWEGVCTRLGAIRSPTFLITGDQDVSTPTANTDILEGLIPGAEKSVVTDGGHGIMYQYPEDFSTRVLGFLGG